MTTYENDPALVGALTQTLKLCQDTCRRQSVNFSHELIEGNFLNECRSLQGGLFAGRRPTFNCVIMNPPYRKISADSDARALLRLISIETSNLYTGFMAVAVLLLDPDGQFVSITPRSFCNGTYFIPFREFFLGRMSLRRIHIFESRDKAFSDDSVLQENIILLARKTPSTGEVVISSSDDADLHHLSEHHVSYEDVVRPEDPDQYIRIVSDPLNHEIARWMGTLQHTLGELSLSVSTGRVVDFRARYYLRKDAEEGTVPLLYPAHIHRNEIVWPLPNGRKPNAIVSDDMTADLLIPPGVYVLVKRFSSKEEPRRIVAAVCNTEKFFPGSIAVENHLNYIHLNGRGLPVVLARGIAGFLNSSIFDLHFRQFSGHTQVNAGDLRKIRFPSREMLYQLGERIGDSFIGQSALDSLCREVIFNMAGETEVWTADAPTHMIHFNGQRFMGPYEQPGKRQRNRAKA